MTFMHALSRRRALLRDTVTVAALAVVASCDLSPVDTSRVEVTQVVIVPDSTTLEPKQDYQFAGYGRTETGDSVAVALVWSTTRGAISPSGHYIADSLEGDYEVRASLASSGADAAVWSVTSKVRVRRLAQLLVTPAGATLRPQGTQAFAAYGRLNGGDSVPVTVTWGATGGSISPAGVYTAGATPGEYAVTAAGKGFSTAAIVTLTNIPVASLSVSPANATVSIGATQQLAAVAKDSAGNTLTGRVVAWSSSNPTVATVSGSGLVTAIAAGSATITATSEGKNGTSVITVPAPPTQPPPVTHAGYYVSPSGSPTGIGSVTQPWNLATALARPTAVQPGDTIWLRGGTYTQTANLTSTLLGTALNPIIVRQYPGERATIDLRDYGFQVAASGGNTWYWGFEVMSSTAPGTCQSGIDVFAPGTKLINLVVHDAQCNGIGFWTSAVDAEIHGSIIYNNGRQTAIAGYAHGIYTQNTAGMKVISDNFLFHNLGFDLHMYGTAAPLKNFVVDGNVGINTGAGQGTGSWLVKTDNALPHENITLSSNMIYTPGGWGEFGPTAPSAVGRFSLVNNYVYGQTGKYRHWQALTVTGNTFANPIVATQLFVNTGYPTSPAYVFNNNSYYVGTGINEFHSWINGVRDMDAASFATWKTRTGYDANSTLVTSASGKPTANKVFLRPNRYEAGRANIVIYNWQGLGNVSVDVSSVLRANDHYELRNVQSFFGPPVLSGTYQGGSLAIPMTAITPPVPLGGWPAAAPRSTGPEFNAFVLVRTSP